MHLCTAVAYALLVRGPCGGSLSHVDARAESVFIRSLLTGSPWRDKISLAILELQEKGVIQILYDKWWKNTGDVCNREDKSKESKASALGVENIGGVFVVLLCGLALAIVVAILEFCWNSKKNAASERQSLCAEMASELRFAVRCRGTRPRRPAKRCGSVGGGGGGECGGGLAGGGPAACPRCSPANTYIAAPLDLSHINGVSCTTLSLSSLFNGSCYVIALTTYNKPSLIATRLPGWTGRPVNVTVCVYRTGETLSRKIWT